MVPVHRKQQYLVNRNHSSNLKHKLSDCACQRLAINIANERVPISINKLKYQDILKHRPALRFPYYQLYIQFAVASHTVAL